MATCFRVLLLDDDEEVIRRLRGRIGVPDRAFEGREYHVDIRPVHVEIEATTSDTFKIGKRTVLDLAAACSQRPHLILADFGYAQRAVFQEFGERWERGIQIKAEDLVGKTFTIFDLTSLVRSFVADPTADQYSRRTLQKNFLDVSSKLCLYSYTAKALKSALGEIQERVNIARAALPHCSVVSFDTWYLFYNGDEFDGPTASKHDHKFYGHLVAGLIDGLIHLEFLEFLLQDSKRLKYIRLRRTTLSVAAIASLGAAIGFTSEWMGARFSALVNSGALTIALALAGLTIFFLFVMGFLLPVLFDRLMSGLLPEDRERQIP